MNAVQGTFWEKIKTTFAKKGDSNHKPEGGSETLPKIALVGTPNVGKSVLFNYLTGAYVTVSNYPGTTVEVSRGKGKIQGRECEIIDTPGIYSLVPITDEERVTRTLLLREKPEVILHVVDAKNIERMLGFTLQLLEAELPVILVLNIMDEAEALGIKFDLRKLERLGIPVVATAAARRRGLDRLQALLAACLEAKAVAEVGPGKGATSEPVVTYAEPIERAIGELTGLLQGEYPLAKRALALLLLQGETEIRQLVAAREERRQEIEEVIRRLQTAYPQSVSYAIALSRQKKVVELLQGVVTPPSGGRITPAERLSRLTLNPVTGIPLLLLVLYFGLYKFVGVFGAGTMVDFLESRVFEAYLNPWINNLVSHYIPWPALQELLARDYGIITLGLRYAIAIILPIVTTFFLFFSVIEDSGYLPRLAMLVDRFFKLIGLNGRAVIPMTLGFGCDTMATMVSRTLETTREKVIATLLLALAIPCSAQLGVILALLAGRPQALFLWAGFITLIFLVVGYLGAQILPGEKPSFYMELPPLRLPKLSNVLTKTYTRMHWYLLEVIPLFVLASTLIWLGRMTGFFPWLVKAIEPLVAAIGLPKQTATIFLFGFFRRDYGAAGLYDLQQAGMLTPRQLLVAAVTLTLFVPCIAQFTMMARERGVKTAIAIFLFTFVAAFGAGYLFNYLLLALGW